MSPVRPLSPGDVLHIPSTGPVHDRGRGHYHVVVTAADDTDKIILAPICSFHEKCDKTCLLDQGSYEVLNRPSHIMYQKMNFYIHTHVVGKIALGHIELLQAVSAGLLIRIMDGVFTSSFSSPVYRKHLKLSMDTEADEAN